MQTITTAGPALLGLAVVIVLLTIVTVVFLMRAGRRRARKAERGDSAMLSMALQEAVTKLKAQERQMAARAEASERLAGQIVEGLTSGMVVVDRDGMVQTMNPAARRILGLDGAPGAGPVGEVLHRVPALAGVITRLYETGEHPGLEKLRTETPQGVLEMLRLPGLSSDRIKKLYSGLGISSVKELEDAARTDGASDGRILWEIILPICLPGVITAAVIAAIFAMNEYLFTLIIASKNAYPLSVALANFSGGSDGIIYNAIALVGFLAFFPALLLVILVQNHLSRGLTMGAVKG